MRKFERLFDGNDYCEPTDIYAMTSRSSLLALTKADNSGENLGLLEVVIDQPHPKFGSLIVGETVTIVVDSIQRRLTLDNRITRLETDYDKHNVEHHSIGGGGELIVPGFDYRLPEDDSDRFGALDAIRFRALIPPSLPQGMTYRDPSHEDRALAVIQLPIFMPK